MYEAPQRRKVYLSRACKVPVSVESQSSAVPFIYGGHASTVFATSSPVAVTVFLFHVIALGIFTIILWTSKKTSILGLTL